MPWPNDVRKKDLRIDFYRGSGAGGQHRNKTDSACRITHLPTGLVAQCEDQRAQHQNRTVAFRRLAEKLVPLMKGALVEERAKVVERIRTYHEPRQTVKDHRTGLSYPYMGVLSGESLDQLFMDCARESRKNPSDTQ